MASSNSWIDSGAQVPVTPAHFDLRPLSTGEILDRTFQLYRSRFTLFAGLAMLPAGVNVVTQALRLWYSAHQSVQIHTGVNLYRTQGISVALALVSSILSLVLYGIIQAATTWAVSAVYLGEPAAIKTAYKAALKHWFRYTVIVLRQVWAGFWLPVVLISTGLGFQAARRGSASANLTAGLLYIVAFFSLVYAIWAYIRVSLAVPAAVVESLTARASIKRSKQLLVDRKVRILLLFVFLFALYLVIGAIQAPLAYFAIRARGSGSILHTRHQPGDRFRHRDARRPPWRDRHLSLLHRRAGSPRRVRHRVDDDEDRAHTDCTDSGRAPADSRCRAGFQFAADF